MKITDLQGKKIAILGFGLEGKSTLRFLTTHDLEFSSLTILDVDQNLKTSSLVNTVTGDNYLENLDQYDVIFKSAGIPINEKLLPYKDEIITQAQLFFDNYKGKVIALTASKGKSTIVSLIYNMLKDVGLNVKLVGNIGNPVLESIDFDKEYDYVILELSSYMLETLKKKNYISVLGAIFPEHLDRHGSFEAYSKAKRNILVGSEHNVVYYDNIEKYNLKEKYSNLISYAGNGKYKWHSGFLMEDDKKLFPESDRNILGEHNLDNICAALAVADTIGLSLETCHNSIKSFKGLPHRMENLGVYGGLEWIDDAISTTPQSTIQAIKSFGKSVGTIFLGGMDRGYDFEELVKYIFDYEISNIVLFPDSGEKILNLLKKNSEKYDTLTIGTIENCIQIQKKISNQNRTLKIFPTESMKSAVAFALEVTSQGKMVLLSTASPSYGVWKDFEEKGDLFKKRIKQLTNRS